MSLFSRLSFAEGQRGDAEKEIHDVDQIARETDEAPGVPEPTTNPGDSDHGTGVLLKTLKPGDITHFPSKGDICTIHYEAFTDAELRESKAPEPFDSSRSRGQPFKFRLRAGQVIAGMDVAVSSMSIGQEVQATIHYSHAYGVAGYPPVVPPRTTLVFRIELLSFENY